MDQLEEILGDGDGGVVRFCFQHAKQAMGERGCFVSPREGRSKWVEFDGESFRALWLSLSLELSADGLDSTRSDAMR